MYNNVLIKQACRLYIMLDVGRIICIWLIVCCVMDVNKFVCYDLDEKDLRVRAQLLLFAGMNARMSQNTHYIFGMPILCTIIIMHLASVVA